ncbi:MAG: tetratricopeptide repeat protein [Rickettsiales bacterium]|jgi:hypothetical protein|nr:tetratricopeptide repeat protein [Rickettsiales bacterium]
MTKNIVKKTRSDHAEDALYREVWEEVHAQKIMDFLRRHMRILIAGAVLILTLVAAIVAVRQIKKSNALELANDYESAMTMNPALAREALTRLAKKTSGGMGDLALFRAYQLAIADNDAAGAISRLELLAAEGATRDFRDLSLVQLAQLKGDEMSADEFQKMLAPLLTKRSPFYFTGLLLVAQKYLSEGNRDAARPFLRKIASDGSAPATISGAAQMLLW